MDDFLNLKNTLQEVFDDSNLAKELSIEVSLSDLNSFAHFISTFIKAGDWFLLDGDLGAGKTSLTKELSLILGAHQQTISPTFSILNIEELNSETELKKLVHLDLYRLKSGRELLYLGLEEEFNPKNSFCVIEWPYNIENDDYLAFFQITKCAKPKRVIEIILELAEKEDVRIYHIKRTHF
ncbi:tRNA (adenosine(37)-N6)-threonylcarbamoyltransferase complex ATPase subunit type 1 TsaE [Fluviispira sanaruensis]|uniref:tRNA threonylcarbamoyladenosine biosynthesis protein TsaE n=1 Tax=Fluviispira sanaruensis TaxID=2493639 RepID=A0A4P2VQD0_FLUSA|nr:tRNA (adenosine(37)-N6)-threonylcarbamoyltransferase complex ATPase subunit type 1 TsaE [Fluviispira sanaruensis]BBH54199.1 hypothetical protein JCM31447_26590 [Fluviispira sanaruensis]